MQHSERSFPANLDSDRAPDADADPGSLVRIPFQSDWSFRVHRFGACEQGGDGHHPFGRNQWGYGGERRSVGQEASKTSSGVLTRGAGPDRDTVPFRPGL